MVVLPKHPLTIRKSLLYVLVGCRTKLWDFCL